MRYFDSISPFKLEHMKNKIKDLMSNYVITIKSDMPFTEACRLFPTIHVHHLPVLDSNDYLIGMFSTTDALFALNNLVHKKIESENDVNRLISVEAIMTSDKIFTLESEAPINEAVKLFQKLNINSIPIVDDGILVGILTSHDILKEFQQLIHIEEEYA